MQSTATESDSETWREIAPLLDDALGTLGEKEHNAIILRFFEGKDFKDVASVLHTGEDAARMRVNRALEKLHKFFCKHGVTSTTAVIAGEISANGVHAAPPALAGAVNCVAMAKGAATGASTLALIHGTLKTMTWAKVKFACGIMAVAILAGSLATLGVAFFPHSVQNDRNDRYQIEGSLVYDTPDYGATCDYMVTVNGSNWAIRRTNFKQTIKHSIDWAALGLKTPPPSGSPFREGYYSEEVCLNGTIFRYDYYGKPPAGSPAQNSGSAEIYYGDSPLDDGTFTDWIWVGLASGYYFHQATNDEVTPLANMGPPEMAKKIRAKAQWKLNDAPPFLPKYIDYFGFPIHGIIVRPGVVIHQFDNGDWTNGEVRVSQETNINGRIFPTEYTYEQFSPNLNSATSTNSVEHQLWVTVKVQNVRLHSVPDVLPPKTHGETAVNDYRLSFSLPVNRKPEPPFDMTYGTTYLSTARRLTEKPEAAAILAYKKQLRMLHMSYVPPPVR